MKKALILLMIIFTPAVAFAEAQIGPTLLYNFPLIEDDRFNPPVLDVVDPSDITFGADFRLKIALFQLGAMGLITPGVRMSDPASGTVTIPASIDIFLDAGIAVDILLFRLGLGAGPNFTVFFDDAATVSDTVSSGVNIKAIADILLGDVSVGLTYLTQFDFDLDNTVSILSADKTKGLLGVSFLFRL